MSELRFNLITREWVIINTDRAKKPEEYRVRLDQKHYRPEHDPACPFCPGNESKTPDEIYRIPYDGQWNIRVTSNKFPVLSSQGEKERRNDGLKHYVSGVGRHEVIVESSRHDMSFAELEDADVIEVIKVYKQRFIECFKDRRVQHVIIFKNHGIGSGTTIMHPHAQLIGTPVMPLQVRARVDESMRYFDYTGECLLCATTADELNDGRRILIESEHFVTFIPYAALSPFHTWIIPKRHCPSFANVTEEELRDFALNLKATLLKISIGLDDPSFNFTFRSLSPFRSRSDYIHWYMSIVPQVMSTSGFELGSGMHVNASVPEEIAEFLRNIKVS